MWVLLAERFPDGGRTAIRAALLLALLLPAIVAAAQPDGASANERWVAQAGDDPGWARPDLDDSAWPRVAVRATWSGLGRQGYDGLLWFRGIVTLGESARLAAKSDELALMLGPPAYGGFEVYAGGRPVGRSSGWASSLPFGRAEVFRIPRAAIASDGTVRLAIRVRRIGWVSDRDVEGGPFSGMVTLGDHRALADRIAASWYTHLSNELPLLVLAVLFGFVSVHHLLLFVRRRKEIVHLWFGLLALAFAINTFASTYWIYEVTASRGIAARTADLTGHLAAAFAIQFLWSFFARPLPRPLRAYQLSHVALALFVGLWPSLRVVFASGTVRWLWLLPLLIVAAAIVLREMRSGHAEARGIAAGGVIMIAVQACELAHNVLPLRWPFGFSVAPFGFAAVVVAMSVALSDRFRRVHDELDRLRHSLASEVLERTHDLAEARDEALAAYRAKGEFLANISHEIRTPMNGVLGMAELLGTTPLNAEQRKQLEVMQVSGRSLLTLLDDVLDFSRLESKSLTVERIPFRPASVVEECLEVMAPLANGKWLVLGSTIAAGTAEALLGDPHRTRQVLLNLVANAIKFTARGSVDVGLSSLPLPDGRVEVRFSVSDTGPGIADGDRARLFVAFQQLDGSASRQHGGAGLGLAISKRMTELMGGTIGVDSSPGRGSTFHFTIAGEPATLAPPHAEPARPAAAHGERSLRILLAEDEAVNRIVILGMLERLGYHAESRYSGLEVLETLEREPYDVLLLDVQMPGIDGLEVTRRIRARPGPQPHIIAVTAHALSGDRERCLAAGMDNYLSKPLSLDDLAEALRGVHARTASPGRFTRTPRRGSGSSDAP